MSRLDRPSNESEWSLINNGLATGLKTLSAAALALQLTADTASGQSQRTLAELTKLPAVCTGNDPEGRCVRELPAQLEELATLLSNPDVVPQQTPLYNPKANWRDVCVFTRSLLNQHGEKFGALQEYLFKYQRPFLERTLADFGKLPDQPIDLVPIIEDVRNQLGVCLISSIYIEGKLAKHKAAVPKALPPLSEAIRLVSKALTDIAEEPRTKRSKEERQAEALEHSKALTNLFAILNAAATHKVAGDRRQERRKR